MADQGKQTALVLTGGGARAAYQVGVLAAIAELLPDKRRNPFPIICGTSAGAVNAAYLATRTDQFAAGVAELRRLWRAFHAGDVYRADALGMGRSAVSWLGAMVAGWLLHKSPRSLLDNSPLRRLLTRHIDFSQIEEGILAGRLRSLSITCSGYGSGQSVSFFQGRNELEPWHRAQRHGSHTKLRIEHLLASSAIPFVFPAVKINREYFGDGSMRQVAPISPAIHLGADRILVIGAGRHAAQEASRTADGVYPTLAQIAGHTLSSIFLDSLWADIERIQRINKTLSLIPEQVRREQGMQLRPIEVLVISPSERLDDLAASHAASLPWPVRTLLGGIGAMNRNGGALTSYLLFERPYTRALTHLGRKDTLARRKEVLRFLDR